MISIVVRFSLRKHPISGVSLRVGKGYRELSFCSLGPAVLLQGPEEANFRWSGQEVGRFMDVVRVYSACVIKSVSYGSMWLKSVTQ